MAQPDRTALLNQAVELFNAGRRAEARTMLSDLTAQAPDMELAWLWLAAASEDFDEKVRALQRVLTLNPTNHKARVALARLNGEQEPSEPATSKTDSPATLERREPAARPAGQQADALTIGLIIAIIIAVIVIVLILLNASRIQGLLRPSPTPTITATTMPSATLRYTYTPTITPGGPTFTPFVTLPPPATWTIAPTETPLPTYTRLPTETTIPTDVSTLRATITPFLSATPSDIPTLAPIPTLPAATGQSSTMVATAILPSATPTATATSTRTATAPSAPNDSAGSGTPITGSQ